MIFRFLVYPLFKAISLLPFTALYAFSDFLYLLFYYVLGYRKKIVRMNMRNAFPEKDAAELKKLEKAFYHHLCDLVLETIKGMSISKEELLKRCVNIDRAIYDELLSRHKNALVVMSHNGNWEWVCLVADLTVDQHAMCIYKTLSNKDFDQWFLKLRSRFGTEPITMERSLRTIIENRNVPNVTAIIGDQNPSNPKNCHWTSFLNQETAFLPGTERIASKMGYAVLYLKMKKVKRGYYVCTTESLFDDGSTTSPGEITEAIARVTEADILSQPHTWLWSHRRWKHKRPVGD